MQFTKIKLRNYRPYYGEVEIEPRTHPDKPVVLIRGKNDTGKTSLFSAIRFCLYGVDSRQDRNNVINRRAATESNGTTSVQVTVTADNGDIYIIERSVEFTQVENPSDRKADNWHREIRTPSETLVGTDDSEDEYRKVINQFLPENIADFFLFDAEKLNRFTKNHDEEIRNSIETILGIKEIENAIADLDGRKSEFERNYAKRKSTSENVAQMRERFQGVIDEISKLQGHDNESEKGKIQEKEDLLKRKQSKLADIEQGLKEADGIEELEEEIGNINERINKIKDELDDELDVRDEMRRNAGPLLAKRGVAAFQSSYDIDAARGEADVVHQILNGDRDTCICGDELTDEKRRQLLDRWKELQGPERRRLEEIKEIAEKLSKIELRDIQRYRRAQSEIQTSRERISEQQDRLDELENERDKIEYQHSDDLKRKKDQVEEEIVELKTEIQDLREKVAELKIKKENLRSRIETQEQASEEAKRLSKLIDFSDALKETFKDAKNWLVSSRRRSVEEAASETFCRLTNRPDYYKGLTITENYNLRVQTKGSDAEGRSLDSQEPSAGQTQIIVYSFIAGLSKYTTRSAPVIIDTPIGRLDPQHKKNLINFYDEFSDQVIILYQPGELDDDDIRQMSDVVSRHYEITIQDDETSSDIEQTSIDAPHIMEGQS